MTVTARLEITDEETGTTYIYTGIKAESLTIETKFEGESNWPPPANRYLIRHAPEMQRLSFDFTHLIRDDEGITYTRTETRAVTG